uniref:Uncharacterized protein n=1 Tax=Lepeophtheirus salmonis TaxID=72036 RepID=A0A0K2UH53_LEPSM
MQTRMINQLRILFFSLSNPLLSLEDTAVFFQRIHRMVKLGSDNDEDNFADLGDVVAALEGDADDATRMKEVD